MRGKKDKGEGLKGGGRRRKKNVGAGKAHRAEKREKGDMKDFFQGEKEEKEQGGEMLKKRHASSTLPLPQASHKILSPPSTPTFFPLQQRDPTYKPIPLLRSAAQNERVRHKTPFLVARKKEDAILEQDF